MSSLFDDADSTLGRLGKFVVDKTVGVVTGLLLLGRGSLADNNANISSLAKMTEMARVEPLTIVSDDLTNQEFIGDIYNVMLSMFSGYYLQAVSLYGDVGKVTVRKTLDQFSTGRSTVFSLEGYREPFNGLARGNPYLIGENYRFSLPFRSMGLEAPPPGRGGGGNNNSGAQQANINTGGNNINVNGSINISSGSSGNSGYQPNPNIPFIATRPFRNSASGRTYKPGDKVDPHDASYDLYHSHHIAIDPKGNVSSGDKLAFLRDANDYLATKENLQVKKDTLVNARRQTDIKEREFMQRVKEYNDTPYAHPGVGNVGYSAANNKDINKTLNEAANPAIGKTFNVTLSYFPTDARTGKVSSKVATVDVPVSVRLVIIPSKPEHVGDILAGKKLESKFSERFNRWMSGRISFWRDLIFCQDLIDEHRDRLMNDKSGILQTIEGRRSEHFISSVWSGNASICDASNIFIITTDVEKQIERVIGGKLKNQQVRKKIGNETSAMFIVVVDKNYERVTIYTRDIAQPTTLSFREIKSVANSSKQGDNVMEVLKQLTMGNPPSF